MSYGIKFKCQNPNVKSNPKPQCQNAFQNGQFFIFYPLCIFTSIGYFWINGWTYIFLHLSFDIHLKFGLWPLSFEFILCTYLDPFRVTIQATPFRGCSWFIFENHVIWAWVLYCYSLPVTSPWVAHIYKWTGIVNSTWCMLVSYLWNSVYFMWIDGAKRLLK